MAGLSWQASKLVASAEMNKWVFFIRRRVWRISGATTSANLPPNEGVTRSLTRDNPAAMTDNLNWKAELTGILENFGCQTGTIHQATGDGKTLTLVCQIGVPDSLLDKISSIPFGKGIAGAAAERKEPVELCNLQQDLGGVAKPDARETGVSGSLAVPIFSETSGNVIGTLGVGKFAPHEFSEAEKTRLERFAREIAGHFGQKGA